VTERAVNVVLAYPPTGIRVALPVRKHHRVERGYAGAPPGEVSGVAFQVLKGVVMSLWEKAPHVFVGEGKKARSQFRRKRPGLSGYGWKNKL
jgi:hypothetical protein